MTKVTEILEQGLEACSKYAEDETVQLEMAKITMKRLENEIIRSGVGLVRDAEGTVPPTSRKELLRL